MRMFFFRCLQAGVLAGLTLPAVMQAESDPATIFKTNCVLCHSANGSGESSTGKALHAKDLRSPEIQKQSDEDLVAAITKGKGKMPSFGAKIKPDDMKKLVAYIRELPKK
jgi:mono/diheme cytochrome c family protein